MSETKVIIIGAGGHGSELASYIRDLTGVGAQIHLTGFVDEAKPRGPWGATEILGNLDDLRSFLSESPETLFHYITAVGDNQSRRQLAGKVEGLGARNLKAFNVQHPTAELGAEVCIGAGTCLAPGSIVTTRVRIGCHSILNVRASVSHDCQVGDFSNLNPGAIICGNVRLGEGCYIGAGATVINNVSIGEWTIVGAGAVVVRDLPPRVTAVGVPARVIKR